MRKMKIFGVVAVAALALTGCGSTCDDLADAFDEVDEKARPCAAAGEEPTAFNVNQCENNVDKCTDSEKEALADLADCLRDLPECTPATENGFGTAAAACILGASGKIGQTCSSALGGN
jgi:hypothetical protein